MSTSQNSRNQKHTDYEKASATDWSGWEWYKDRNQYGCYRRLSSGEVEWNFSDPVKAQSSGGYPGVSQSVEALSTSLDQVQIGQSSYPDSDTYSSALDIGTASYGYQAVAVSSPSPYYPSAKSMNAGSDPPALIPYNSTPSTSSSHQSPQQTVPQMPEGEFVPVSIASSKGSRGKTAIALLDSSSVAGDFISLQKLKDLGIGHSSTHRHGSQSTIRNAEGMAVQNIGSIILDLLIGSRRCSLRFKVFDTNQFEIVLSHHVERNVINRETEPSSYDSTGPGKMRLSQNPLLSIHLYGKENIIRQTLALRDTGSLNHNWISAQMVEDLGLSSSISRHGGYPSYVGTIQATGERITSIGYISVQWGLPDQEKWTASFNVWHSKDFSVIFGHKYMYNMSMVEFSNVGIAPRIPAKKEKEAEKKERLAKEEADNKARLEAQRRREAHEAKKVNK